MATLAETIRAIRQRLKQTMSEFGELIGADQSTVSRYEAGQVVPSRTTLILLFLLAQGEERKKVAEALGDIDESTLHARFSRIQDSLRSLLPRREGHRRAQTSTTLVEFAEQCEALCSTAKHIDPALVRLVRLFRDHGQNPKLGQALSQMLPYYEFVATHPSRRGRRSIE